jgi:hypothetical protein
MGMSRGAVLFSARLRFPVSLQQGAIMAVRIFQKADDGTIREVFWFRENRKSVILPFKDVALMISIS